MLLLLFSCSVMSDFLLPHGLLHAKLPYLSPSPRVCSNSCPFSQWCHPTILSSVTPFSSCFQSFPASGSFPMHQLFASGGQSIEIFSFSINPSNEYWGLISLRIELVWFPWSPKDSQEPSPEPQFEGINSLALCLLYGLLLTSVHDYWKDHSLDFTDLCWQSDVSAF